jgi:hypothetical protein
MRYVCKSGQPAMASMSSWLATWLVCGIHDGGAMGSVCVSHEDSCAGATVRRCFFRLRLRPGEGEGEGEGEVVSRYLGDGGRRR